MPRTDLVCPDCKIPAKFIRLAAEEVILPVNFDEKKLQRIPPLKAVGRWLVVQCSKHGEKWIFEAGHHVSTIPKKRSPKNGCAMSKRHFACPICGGDTEFVCLYAEEGSILVTEMHKPRKRVPSTKSVARNFLVRCPIHGEKIVQEFGHHFQDIPKGTSRKRLK